MTKDAVWGYKMTNGEVESKLFKDGKLPQGWKDSPAKCKGKGK